MPRTVVAACAVALLVVGCQPTGPDIDSPAQQQVFPPFDWPVTSPASAGLDTASVDSLLEDVRSRSFIFSLLIVRHDSLAVEYYRTGLNVMNDYDIRSATKSIVSTLVGITLDDGLLVSLDTPFLDVFPEYRTSGMDPRKDSITMRHLLTMRGGFDYVDGGKNADVVGASDDWVGAFFGLPLLFSPGERFAYSSLQTHLLSAVISRTTGSSTLDVLQQKLFSPLHISVRYWDEDPQGIHNGGTGMFLTPRDMARFGQLLLRKGTIGSETIIRPAWVDSSFAPRNMQDLSWADFSAVNYGYQWWMNREPGEEVWFAAGYGGQFIVIVPDRDLVIVTTADTPVEPAQASSQESVLLHLISRYVLPAAQ